MKAFLLLLAAALAAKIKILSPASLVADLSAIRPNAELKGSDANFGHIPYGKTVVRLFSFLFLVRACQLRLHPRHQRHRRLLQDPNRRRAGTNRPSH